MRAAAVLLTFFALPALAEAVHSDDFTLDRRYERVGPDVWSLADGACRFRAGESDSWLVVPGREAGGLTVEATLRLDDQPQATGRYSLAGVACRRGDRDHWRLLLVEAPDGRRYFELVERLEDVHQAQTGALPGAGMAAEDAGDLSSWEPGRAYRLSLRVTGEAILGRVTEIATGAKWERRYAVGQARALTAGRGALNAAGVSGACDDFGAVHDDSARRPTLAIPDRGLAILDDPEGAVAEGLERLVRGAGHEATIVTWAELETHDVPFERGVTLVLADARRLPLRARDEVLAGLSSGGRVLAVGAPAFAELLARYDESWLGRTDYRRAQVARAPLEPVSLGEPWQRGTSDPERDGAIEPSPEDGPDAWRVTSDLAQWDTWTTPVTFAPEAGVVVVEVRSASAGTVVLECVEHDGSRWIAVLPTTPDWQVVALSPTDFAYWRDSQAVGRGAPGDAVHLSDVQRIAIGLAKSHAPQLASGPHEYGFRSLATARAGDLPSLDWSTPLIEALCPAYRQYPLDAARRLEAASEQLLWTDRVDEADLPPLFASVWRERGRGCERGRAARWIPVAEASDSSRERSGAIAWLVRGDGVAPGASWAALGVAEPSDALRPEFAPIVLALLKGLAAPAALLEAGAEQFAYADGETVRLGAEVAGLSDRAAAVRVRVRVSTREREEAFAAEQELEMAPGETRRATWEWEPARLDSAGYEVTVTLEADGVPVDLVTHGVERLQTEPARPDEFVRAGPDGLSLNGAPWPFSGVNYWPTWVTGCPDMNLRARERYDPEVVERDLARLAASGINAISAVVGLQPPNPGDPLAFRDQRDFLDRCLRHGIRVHFTLPYGWPLNGGEPARAIAWIEAAGLRDHPAILAWELAWEPIEGWWGRGFAFLLDDWNAWVLERYGSIDQAVADWGFDPRPGAEGPLTAPTGEQCRAQGAWSVYVAAFRRAFSDLVSRAYGPMARALRRYDPNHLIAFRGGACGIPSGQAFAHIHSVGVAKHMDYLCPEGYNLQTWEWKAATDPDSIRAGGLITRYYDFVSRGKPVVWMEFGYTVNGLGREWRPELLRIDPAMLEVQRSEYEAFYAMFLESAAAGAAPWWLPGGFRVGENSDFGLWEPDGAARPAWQVVRDRSPLLGLPVEERPARLLAIDLDAHTADAWEFYGPRYLDAVRAGEQVTLVTDGTGTDSATCPLTAVGGRPHNGHNPPCFLNAEYNTLELRVGDGPWIEATPALEVGVPAGAEVRCRGSVGNLGEAAWLAPRGGEAWGRVYLAGRGEYGWEFEEPIAADTPYLGDAEVAEFVLLARGGVGDPLAAGPVTVSFEMSSARRAFFGERRTVVLRPE